MLLKSFFQKIIFVGTSVGFLILPSIGASQSMESIIEPLPDLLIEDMDGCTGLQVQYETIEGQTRLIMQTSRQSWRRVGRKGTKRRKFVTRKCSLSISVNDPCQELTPVENSEQGCLPSHLRLFKGSYRGGRWQMNEIEPIEIDPSNPEVTLDLKAKRRRRMPYRWMVLEETPTVEKAPLTGIIPPTEQFCIALLTCAKNQDGVTQWYSTPCAARDDNAEIVSDELCQVVTIQ